MLNMQTDERPPALRFWHMLNNQEFFFNVLKRNLTENAVSGEIIRGEIPDTYELDNPYIEKINAVLIAGLKDKSNSFNIISERFPRIETALKQCSIPEIEKDNTIILLSEALYNKIPSSAFRQAKEYRALGNCPGTRTGFITSSWNNISIFPILLENEIYVINNNTFFINVIKQPYIVNEHLEIQLELVCTDYGKQYKIILT